MNDVRREDGFLVFDSISGQIGGRFFTNKEKAEEEAQRNLKNLRPVFLVQAARFTNEEVRQWSGERLDNE